MKRNMWTENSNMLFWIIIRPKFRNMSKKPGWRNHSLLNSISRPASRVAMCDGEEWDSGFKNVMTRFQSLKGLLTNTTTDGSTQPLLWLDCGLNRKIGVRFSTQNMFFLFSRTPKLNVELRSNTLHKSKIFIGQCLITDSRDTSYHEVMFSLTALLINTPTIPVQLNDTKRKLQTVALTDLHSFKCSQFQSIHENYVPHQREGLVAANSAL